LRDGGRFLARAIASGLGSGYFPVAPGTAGSLAALLIGAALLAWSPWALAAAAVAATGTGLWAVARAACGGDPSWVVIDEFAGQWMTMLALARPSPLGLVLAFLLFRLFDILKPGPVGWADRQSGAAGVMGDDLIAGAIAAALLILLRTAFPAILA
jgi:phosphatidylglycerophosphatase A